jgi:uncharacterized membrane protein SpoIIM required for sporulation
VTADGWIERARPAWLRLEAFAARLGRLAPAEMLEFVALYRRATCDLARARTLDAPPEIVEYLNDLVGRIHFQVYSVPSRGLQRIAEFFAALFPRAVRRNRGYVLASALLLLLPAAAGYAMVAADPALLRVLAPPEFADQIDQYGAVSSMGWSDLSGMTGFYVANNTQVSFFAFAGGLLVGIGSLFVLVNNGALLGAVFAGAAGAGQLGPLLDFIASHAALELTAIVLGGAAGLRLGAALLNPGDVTRPRALVEAGREAGLIMFGVIALLALAAVFEAWVSHALPSALRWGVGIANAGWLFAYLALAGRRAGASS